MMMLKSVTKMAIENNWSMWKCEKMNEIMDYMVIIYEETEEGELLPSIEETKEDVVGLLQDISSVVERGGKISNVITPCTLEVYNPKVTITKAKTEDSITITTKGVDKFGSKVKYIKTFKNIEGN